MRRNVRSRVVDVCDVALLRPHRDRPLHAVLALLAERDADDAARGVGVVIGSRDGYHLDLLDLLGAQRAQVGGQLFGFEPQLAVVDEYLRAALAVDRDLLVVDPYAGCPFEQFDAVLADGGRGVGHIHHKPVGFAPYQPGLDHDPLDLRRAAFHHEIPQIVLLFDLHLLRQGLVAEILDAERVVARRGLQLEATLAVGGHSGNLLRILQQYDGRILHGFALFIHHASLRGKQPGRKSPLCRKGHHHNPGNQCFHTILLFSVFCRAL